MFKGCQRKIIMLKNTGSGIFDEAYFVIKENATISNRVSENDMIAEANKILNENKLSDYCLKSVKKNQKLKRFIIMLSIVAFSAIIACVVILTVIFSRI